MIDMNAEIFLELIQNHEIWFSSLIGFFYQHGIGCNVNKDKALEMYLMAIKQDRVQIPNSIIAKYLLSLYYYKDIILINKFSMDLTINSPIYLIKEDEKKELQEDESNMYIIKDDEGKDLQKGENYNQKNKKDDVLDLKIKMNPDEKTAFVLYLKHLILRIHPGLILHKMLEYHSKVVGEPFH